MISYLTGLYCLAREYSTCRLGWHSSQKHRVHKWNGGNTCWTCGYCALIVKYDQE